MDHYCITLHINAYLKKYLEINLSNSMQEFFAIKIIIIGNGENDFFIIKTIMLSGFRKMYVLDTYALDIKIMTLHWVKMITDINCFPKLN